MDISQELLRFFALPAAFAAFLLAVQSAGGLLPRTSVALQVATMP